MLYHRRTYIISISRAGTARITWADGTQMTLYRQRSVAQAVRKAWRMKRHATN